MIEVIIIVFVLCEGVILFMVYFEIFDLVCLGFDYVSIVCWELFLCFVLFNFFVFGGSNVVFVFCVLV